MRGRPAGDGNLCRVFQMNSVTQMLTQMLTRSCIILNQPYAKNRFASTE